ncbi:hypothetical protein ACA910_005216 [Epithemia clementina (nom. ined.)]
MGDTYEEVTSESWGSRLKGSCGSVVFGVIVVFASIGALIWNESNLVAARKALDEGEYLVQELPSITVVDKTFDNRLVHLTGLARTSSLVEDPDFGVSLSSTLKLQRSVEMYQWLRSKEVEQKKKAGGSVETITTYTYSQEWVNYLVDSSDFKEGYENPTSMPFHDFIDTADPITLGAFTLPKEVCDNINSYVPLSTSPKLADIPEATKSISSSIISVYHNTGFYFGNGTDASPKVGDVRVFFSQIPAQNISIVARQTGNTFSRYKVSNGRTILIVKEGTFSADAMFEDANNTLTMLTWLIRLGAFAAMWIALQLLAEPLVVFADVLPILGNCVEGITCAVSGLVAFTISLVTIAVAWLVFRPFFSLALLGVAGAIGFAVATLRRRSRKNGYDEVLNV